MQKTKAKSLKSKLLKHVAMFMGICYLLNLLQYQINPALHALAHIFESANNLSSHQQTYNDDHDEHGHDEHILLEFDHEHTLIDFVDSLFGTNDHEDDTEESILVESKVDKHVNLKTYRKKVLTTFLNKQPFFAYTTKAEKGHPLKAKEPPRAI